MQPTESQWDRRKKQTESLLPTMSRICAAFAAAMAMSSVMESSPASRKCATTRLPNDHFGADVYTESLVVVPRGRAAETLTSFLHQGCSESRSLHLYPGSWPFIMAMIMAPTTMQYCSNLHMCIRPYSFYHPVPWANCGDPIAFAGLGAAENKSIALEGFCRNIVALQSWTEGA